MAVTNAKRKAASAARSRCSRGHEFTASNTYVDPSGKRVCRQCRARTEAIYRRRKKTQCQRDV